VAYTDGCYAIVKVPAIIEPGRDDVMPVFADISPLAILFDSSQVLLKQLALFKRGFTANVPVLSI